MAVTARTGPFELVQTVHEGQFSSVHRCRDVGVDREVAVKTIASHPADVALAHERLEREAAVRGTVRHPRVLDLYARCAAGEEPLLVGPWLAAGSLEACVDGPLAARQVVVLADGVGAALDALHAEGWWHGDVNAGNVLLATWPPRAAGPVTAADVVLADFGTSRRLGERPQERGTLVTTPIVTAPEVWAGEPAAASSDIYSLGVLVFFALTGEYPFDPVDPETLSALHGEEPVPKPSELVAVGSDVEGVVLRALSKRPEDRFASGAALAGALRDALGKDRRGGTPGPGLALRPAQPESTRQEHGRGAKTTVRALGSRLGVVAEGFSERERRALSAVLELSRAREAEATATVGRLAIRMFGPPSALLALEQTGAADALACGALDAAQVAASCGVPQDALEHVLLLLASMGVLRRDDSGRFALSRDLELAYHGGASSMSASPIREAAELWAHLPERVASGRPFVQMDAGHGATYAEVTPWMGDVFARDAGLLARRLRELDAATPGARVLDVGAGSGVWSLALAALDEAVTVTALDRPLVLRTTRARAAAAGLGDRLALLAGDWRDVAIPDRSFDVAFLANICHLECGEDVALLLARVREALRDGGIVVIVDTVPERLHEDAGALLQSLHLSLRAAHGRVHGRGDYDGWLSVTGFEAVTVVDLAGGLRALVGRRRVVALPARASVEP